MLYLLIIAFLQIVIESLPVSSSGNCALGIRLLELYTNIKTGPITTDVDFLMHGPTIAVVVLSFFNTIAWYVLHRGQVWDHIFRFFIACCIVDAITLVGYVLFRYCKIITIPTWFGFVITTGLLLSLPFCAPGYKNLIEYQDALIIGVVQALSLLPGISRLGATYVVTCWLGYSPFHALGYSFAFQFPLLCAAFCKGVYSLATKPLLRAIITWQLLACSAVATVVGYYALQFVIWLSSQGLLYHTAWYVAGTAALAYVYGI